MGVIQYSLGGIRKETITPLIILEEPESFCWARAIPGVSLLPLNCLDLFLHKEPYCLVICQEKFGRVLTGDSDLVTAGCRG